MTVAPAAVASDMSEISHVSCFSGRKSTGRRVSPPISLPGQSDASCTNSDFISHYYCQRIASYPLLVQGWIDGRMGGRFPSVCSAVAAVVVVVDGNRHRRHHHLRPIHYSTRLRVRYFTTRALTRRSADRWLLQLARSGTCGAPPTTRRTRGLRVRPGPLASTYCRYCRYAPNPIPCQRYHE